MQELAEIVKQYQKHSTLSGFITDYLSARDELLAGKLPTKQNLEEITPKIKANLELKLTQYKAAA